MTAANIQAAFSQQTSVTKKYLIQKGQVNRYRIRPTILNEHVETARQIQGVVSAGNSIGQIFKTCEDNINGPQPFSRFLDPGVKLVGGWTGNFSNKQLHTTNTQQWKDGKRHHDNTHSP